MRGENETVDLACAVCERHLLPGERPSAFVTSAGTEVAVCELCKPRAEAAGWLRPEEAAAGRTPRTSRRERGQILGGLLAGRPTRSRSERHEVESAERVPEREQRQTAPAQDDDPPHDDPGATDVATAIGGFNGSEHRRTVAGLTRTLGRPKATALAVRTASGAPGARITIAWELAWYQWEVGPGGRGPEIRQTAKGETIDQLRAADRNWNLEIDDDGTLRRKPAGEA